MRKLYLVMVMYFFFTCQLIAQTKTLTGKVSDEADNPLTGASISAVGNKANAVTDISGKFTINVTTATKEIEISYVGYNTERVPIAGVTNISVALKVAGTPLEGVIVTGYGKIKKSTYSGASARVDKKAIEMVPMASLDQLLQARTPGLLVTSGSGQPGSSARVQIRGATSITGNSQPLYVGSPGTELEFAL